MSGKSSYIRTHILEGLNQGKFKVGSRLPTESEFCRKYQMARGTVREGISALVKEGILARRRGAGTFVQNLTPPNRVKIIAAMISCIREGNTAAHLIRAIEDRLHESGYSLILCNHDNDPEKIEQYLQRLSQDKVSGVVFAPIELPDSMEKNLHVVTRLEEKNLPFVLMGTPISAETLGHYSIVTTNGFAAAREMVKHLFRLGHRRIAFINFPGSYTTDQRLGGFLKEMKQQGLELPDNYLKNLKIEPVEKQGQEEIRELLALPAPPTAVICIHDGIAKNAIEEVQRMGLTVPQNIAITGFGDMDAAAAMDPPLTTVRLCTDQEGAWLTKILLDKIHGQVAGEQQMFLTCDLAIRKSCGAKILETQNSILKTGSLDPAGNTNIKLSETPL